MIFLLSIFTIVVDPPLRLPGTHVTSSPLLHLLVSSSQTPALYIYLNHTQTPAMKVFTYLVVALTTATTTAATDYFPLWLDPPSTSTGTATTTPWYELIKTSAGQSFVNSAGQTIQVNMGQGKGTIHLYADPAFQQHKDDAIRSFSGPLSKNLTGTIDRCGWPDQTAANASVDHQWSRRATPMHEDFSNGLDPATIVVGLQKGCCDVDKYASNPYHKNINIVEDVVDGVTKPVLQLTAYNVDNPTLCPGPRCKKDVSSSGTVATANIFASGKYEVRAKVPKASGLVSFEPLSFNECSIDT